MNTSKRPHGTAMTPEIDLRLRPGPLYKLLLVLLMAGTCSWLTAAAAAQSCCQLTGARCVSDVDSTSCQRVGGQAVLGARCNATNSICVPSAPLLRPRHRPRPVHSLRRHTILRPPIVATSSPLPTPTPTPIVTGCCRIGVDRESFCGNTDGLACARAGGAFVLDGQCNGTNNTCSPATPNGPVGCCQLGNINAPFCGTATSAAACTQVGGVFSTSAVCDSFSSRCLGVEPPRCGDGIIEPGEECETDANCGTSVEGCSECQCIGAVLVSLRWTNQNDLNLRVIDPLGRVLLAPDDANASCRDTTNAPEEDIYFAPGRAPLGCYIVEARFDQDCSQAGGVDTHLDLRLNVEGNKATVHDVPGPQPGEVFRTQFGVRAACGGPPPLP